MKSNIWLRMSLSSIRIVDVRTVCSFGETESKDRPFPEKLGRFLLGLLVLTHPDGLQAEDGHLEAIPVTQAIKDQEFAVGDVAGRIPTPIRITVTIGLGCKQLGKDSFFFNKIDKLLVSNLFIEILEEPGLPHGFEESDCLCHAVTFAKPCEHVTALPQASGYAVTFLFAIVRLERLARELCGRSTLCL